MPTPHLLNQSVQEHNVTLISGISNLTNQEEQLQNEKDRIMQQMAEKFRAKLGVGSSAGELPEGLKAGSGLPGGLAGMYQ